MEEYKTTISFKGKNERKIEYKKVLGMFVWVSAKYDVLVL